jgi:mono/diheme cytochrome c family protein
MKFRTVLFGAAILASLNFAAGAQQRTAQGMMGGGMMGGRIHPGGSVPGATGTAPTPDGAGAVETVCGFAGGNPTHGGAIYAQTCVGCHGSDGRGRIPGAPNFTTRGGVLSKPHAVLEAHIKNGFSSPDSPVSMPPGGGNPNLTGQDIRDVHAYLHQAFGCG